MSGASDHAKFDPPKTINDGPWWHHFGRPLAKDGVSDPKAAVPHGWILGI